MKKDWILLDAEGVVLGRLAAFLAHRLRGKHKATYTPHMDDGDHVVVVNAGLVSMTGNKATKKVHYRHTGYPGGIKSTTPKLILESKFPENLLRQAVRRMLPRGSLGRQQLRNLHIYSGAEHKHQAQKPQQIDFTSMNRKNEVARA